MTLPEIILYMFIGTPAEREIWHAKAKAFCEKHLLADDPYENNEDDDWKGPWE